MTEPVTESATEAQGLTGRNRVMVTLISSVVTIVLALIGAGYLPSGSSQASAAAPVSAPAAEPSTTQAADSPPKLWKIKVDLEPEETADAVRLVRVIQDSSPDSDGQVVFTDVPEGVYRLYVVLKDREINVTVDTDEPHKDVRPPLRGVKSIEQ